MTALAVGRKSQQEGKPVIVTKRRKVLVGAAAAATARAFIPGPPPVP
jgi:hypothetical protein